MIDSRCGRDYRTNAFGVYSPALFCAQTPCFQGYSCSRPVVASRLKIRKYTPFSSLAGVSNTTPSDAAGRPRIAVRRGWLMCWVSGERPSSDTSGSRGNPECLAGPAVVCRPRTSQYRRSRRPAKFAWRPDTYTQRAPRPLHWQIRALGEKPTLSRRATVPTAPGTRRLGEGPVSRRVSTPRKVSTPCLRDLRLDALLGEHVIELHAPSVSPSVTTTITDRAAATATKPGKPRGNGGFRRQPGCTTKSRYGAELIDRGSSGRSPSLPGRVDRRAPCHLLQSPLAGTCRVS